MPLYQYECDYCGHKFEEIHSMNDSNVPVESYCPYCEEDGFVRRLMSAGSFVIHGYNAANGYSSKKSNKRE